MNTGQFGRQIEILMAEDNPDDVELTLEALHHAKVGNNLTVVKDGIDLLSFLRGESQYEGRKLPDLILLDLNMPRMDGREALTEIKAAPEFKHIPVVVLTTSSAEDDIVKAYMHHANCYITKPVDFNQFVEVVQSIEDFWLTVVKLPARQMA